MANNLNQGIPIQYPYTNNNLITNTPYENYMVRSNSNQNVNQFLKCRPVSSKQEARAAQIDLDGSLWVFTDVANGKIYTKQINMNGTATFKTYAFTEDEDPYDNSEYVTKQEFNKVIQDLMAVVQSMNQQTVEPVNNNQNKKPVANF